jgi:hypothetical protein
VLHSPSARQEWVDSRLLVVGSQTASLTPGPSFAHNLGCRCPNDQCEAISDIYTSRPFQWHQEHPKARCFAPCYRTIDIRESRRTPNPQLWECEFHPHTWPKWGCDIWTDLWVYLNFKKWHLNFEKFNLKFDIITLIINKFILCLLNLWLLIIIINNNNI